ncbi:NADH:ubiquinone oxidoreductase [Pichia californica]|uniref:NADH:ubiquinone reductase (non-electrogenic) n=1 Tax=Pichia californica TaxID=460514 RepID=A0A9P7BHM7_9ASCO|nr:NADH:ubiquinone oxidoreductase [[Candida] californica]
MFALGARTALNRSSIIGLNSFIRSVSIKRSLSSINTNSTVAKSAKPLKSGFFAWSFRAVVFSGIAGWCYLTWLVYKESNPGKQIPQSEFKESGNKKKNIVILGSGWGAISFLKDLDTTQYNVTIVSPRNYFLFTPLLPSVPSGTINIKSICDSVRTIACQNTGEVKYLEAAATDIDPVKKTVSIQHKNQRFLIGDAFTADRVPIETTLDYDYLVYAVGATVNTFNIPGVYEHASFLKEANDATAVRQKIFNQIEASRLLPKDSDDRKRLLSFVVCGGGPTGVELAAEIKDYIYQDLSKFIPGIENEMSVTLIEAQHNVLSMFHPRLIEYTKDVFKQQGLNLKVDTMVKKIDDNNVYATYRHPDGKTEDVVIPYGTLVWAGGNKQRDITTKLSSKIIEQSTARRGLLVDDYFKLDGDENIYAIGDCTFTTNPPTAQVAHQQGSFLANHFNKQAKIDDLKYLISNSTDPNEIAKFNKRLERTLKIDKPFEYVHQGALAYIGSERAVADLTWGDWSTVALGGTMTFFFWRTAYVTMLLGIRNKIFVVSDWLKVGIFGRDCSSNE